MARRYRPSATGRSVIESSDFTLLQERYKISKESVIGEGGFAKVFRGLDTKECMGVAVKVYNCTGTKSSESFLKSVEVLSKLHKIEVSGMDKASSVGGMATTSSYKPGLLRKDLASMKSVGDSSAEKLPDKVLRDMNFQDCFVKLLGYSCDCHGHPGLDIETESYFLIFELGESSMDEVLAKCKEDGETLSNDELRSLHWALISIVCGLHNEGYVHLDIKPVNIVRFSGREKGQFQWKLIDLDGAMKTGCEVPLTDVVFTPQYMSPELAHACITARREHKKDNASGGTEASSAAREVPRLKLSRLMDVWSVGMCALEAIFLTPVLDPWYREWMEETGSDAKFLDWLGDTTTDPIISGSMNEALNDIDKDMCRMLKGMLTKGQKIRISITECVNHAWLKPIRLAIQSDIDEILANTLTGSCSTVSSSKSPNKTPATGGLKVPCRWTESSSESPSQDMEALASSASNVHPTGTEQARLVVTGVMTRTCVTM